MFGNLPFPLSDKLLTCKMGQQEVITFLKENKKKWFTARQTAEALKASFTSITTSLKKLRQSNQIEHKTIVINTLGRKKVFVYKFKE